MLFMSLCILGICGLIILSNAFCQIPKVKKAIEKLLSM